MLEETLGFYVKATGKDESLMRGQFTRMKLESLRKERDHWRTRAEAKQRLEDKKEEAWELFQRQPGWGPKGRKDFKRAYEQKVTTKRFSPFDLCSPDADEKSLQEWVEKLLVKALAEDRKKEATKCQKMRQEDANSRWRQSWEKLREINFAVQLTDTMTQCCVKQGISCLTLHDQGASQRMKPTLLVIDLESLWIVVTVLLESIQKVLWFGQ